MRKETDFVSQTEVYTYSWAGKVCTPDDLVDFINAVGCCTMKALAGYPYFPNQDEVMGKVDAAVPDPWFWKDDLHIEKRIYYTRVLGNQPGYLSFELLPALIATNGAVADELIFNGAFSPEAQQIYHIIRTQGPIPTKELKRQLSSDAKRAANRVFHDLERRFIITKTDITGRTRGTYGYVWDLVERWIPDVLAAADNLGRSQAEALIREHLQQFGVPPDSAFYNKVLKWVV